jgi:hypothetical protein
MNHDRAELDQAEFRKLLRGLANLRTPGLGGLRNEHLLALVFPAHSGASPKALDAENQLFRLAQHIVKGTMPSYFYTLFTSVRCVPLNKKHLEELNEGDIMDCRPVGIGNSLRCLITKALFKQFTNIFIQATAPMQYGCGEKAGGSKMIFNLSAHMKANPTHTLASLDYSNAFNEASREQILEALWTVPDLRPIWAFIYHILVPKSHVGVGSGHNLTTAPFLSEEGTQQGAIEASHLFCLVVHAINRSTNAYLNRHGGLLVAGMDDTYMAAPLEALIAALTPHRDALQTVGLSLNVSKTKAFIDARYRTPQHSLQISAAGLKYGTIKLPDDTTAFGLTIYGVSVGDPSFIQQSLREKALALSSEGDTIREYLDVHKHPQPHIPCRQAAFTILLRCLQHQGSYWTRHLHPRLTEEFSSIVDARTSSMFKTATTIDLDNATRVTKTRFELPIKHKGVGIQNLSKRRHLDFIGGVTQTLPFLLSSTDRRGNIRLGRVQLDSTTSFLGETSFDQGELHPWRTLLSNSTSEFGLGSAIKCAWEGIQHQFDNTGEAKNSDQFMGQPLDRAGFSKDGKIPNSATHELSKEMDKATLISLTKYVKEAATSADTSILQQAQVVAFQNVDRYSSAFLVSLPDRLGFMKDVFFADAMAQYLGLPAPSLRDKTDHFIGMKMKNKQNILRVDAYGIAVASVNIPGGDWIHAHQDIQRAIKYIVQRAGKSAILEARNWTQGKIPAHVQHAYDADNLENPQGHAIIPDICVHEWERDNSLLIEIKRNGINKDFANYSMKSEARAVDRRAIKVKKEYTAKCKKCDERYAGDNSGSGPFLGALESYSGGGIYPITVGAYGEINKEFDAFLQRCAKLAAARQDGIESTPENQATSNKATYSLIISKFRKIMGCVAMKANLKIRHRRMLFIATTEDGAHRAATQQRNRYSGGFQNKESSWFSSQDDDGTYAEYNKFRNTHRSMDSTREPFL